jgi:methyl-accepting chemotaxis protein
VRVDSAFLPAPDEAVMKLEAKVGVTAVLTGMVVLAGAGVAQNRIGEADRLAAAIQSTAATSAQQEDFRNLRSAQHEAVEGLWIAAALGALLGGVASMASIHQLVRSLQRVSEQTDAIARGDLSLAELEVAGGDEVTDLAVAINAMQRNLRGTMGALALNTGTLAASADEMRAASEGVHRRMDQQSQQTQQAAAAMAEMSASFAEVSRHTQDAAQTARDAATTANEGGTIVREVLGSIQKIAAAVSETSASVGLLGDDSRKISQVVNVIDEIAKKTNLLALNAAIEAARAGEHGRGFAVVAGEVRRLAESTAAATNEIAGMIQAVQQRMCSAVASMENGTEMVHAGVATTTQAGAALERIIGMAERVERMIAQIAIATTQQAAAADQSSTSLDAIHGLSDGNLTEMALSAERVDGLRATAEAIERQVELFRVAA